MILWKEKRERGWAVEHRHTHVYALLIDSQPNKKTRMNADGEERERWTCGMQDQREYVVLSNDYLVKG